MSRHVTTEPDRAIPRGRPISAGRLTILLGPALAITVLLFGGGLVLGLFQAMGYGGGSSDMQHGMHHFFNVLRDPGFLHALGLTSYIAGVSTIIAALASVLLALALMGLSSTSRLINFLLQVPLTVPHLVIAISALLLLAPSGMISRLLLWLGLIESTSSFPLLVNDPWCIGIITVYVWKEIPFITLMLLAVLKNSGPELLEAGATLNAGRYQRFRYITLPIIGPNLGGASLIVFAFTFGAFEVPYLLGQTYPMVLPVWAYRNYSDVDLLARPEGIAIGVLIALIVIVIVGISQLVAAGSRWREV